MSFDIIYPFFLNKQPVSNHVTFIASLIGNLDVVNLLIQANSSTNIRDKTGKTALIAGFI